MYIIKANHSCVNKKPRQKETKKRGQAQNASILRGREEEWRKSTDIPKVGPPWSSHQHQEITKIYLPGDYYWSQTSSTSCDLAILLLGTCSSEISAYKNK